METMDDTIEKLTATLQALIADSRVESAFPDILISSNGQHVHFIETLNIADSRQHPYKRIGLEEAWRQLEYMSNEDLLRNDNVEVAIIEVGGLYPPSNTNNPEKLYKTILTNEFDWNKIKSESVIGTPTSDTKLQDGRHNAAVSAIIIAQNNKQNSVFRQNYSGSFSGIITSVPKINYYVYNYRIGEQFASLLSTMDHIAANTESVDIANMSFGSNLHDNILVNIICESSPYCSSDRHRNGKLNELFSRMNEIIFVTSAGNSPDVMANKQIPASSSIDNHNVITVGGTETLRQSINRSPKRHLESAYGTAITIGAPFEVHTINPDVGYSPLPGGTSLSAPMVTGVIALLSSIDPNLSSSEIRDILTLMADGVTHHNNCENTFVDSNGVQVTEKISCPDAANDTWGQVNAAAAIDELIRRKVNAEIAKINHDNVRIERDEEEGYDYVAVPITIRNTGDLTYSFLIHASSSRSTSTWKKNIIIPSGSEENVVVRFRDTRPGIINATVEVGWVDVEDVDGDGEIEHNMDVDGDGRRNEIEHVFNRLGHPSVFSIVVPQRGRTITQPPITPVPEPPTRPTSPSSVCGRTEQVVKAILHEVSVVSRCQNVTSQHLSRITSLHLENKNIRSLRSGDFSGLSNMETLRLSENYLASLPNGIFNELSSLKRLLLTDNEFTSLQANIFNGLSSLELLQLRDNDLTSLSTGVFNGLPKLKKLYLDENNLRSLPSDLFRGLSRLDYLRWDDNPISDLPPSYFQGSGLNNLEKLRMGNKSPSNEQLDAYKAVLPRLSSLKVKSTQLATQPSINQPANTEPTASCGNSPLNGRTRKVADAIVDEVSGISRCRDVTAQHLSQLKRLSVTEVNLRDLRSGDFNGLAKLQRHLNLDENQLTWLPTDIFRGLSRLERIDLEDNNLTQLHEDTFNGLGRLKFIDLEGNNIRSFPEDIFDGLDRIRTLFLGENALTSLSENIFQGLPRLRTIHLNGNNIGSLHHDTFDGLSALRSLWLHDNNLSSLPANLFDDLSNLERLYLQGNRLGNLSPSYFSGQSLNNLRTLYLGNTDATPEQLAQYRAVLPNLTSLKLVSRNPGELIWRYQTSDNVESPPAISGNTVYFGSNDNHVYALNKTDGSLVWKYPTGDDIRWSGPTIHGDTLYIGSGDNHLYALNTSDGTRKWRYQTGHDLTRQIPTVSDGVVYFGSDDNHLYAVNTSDGTRKWRYQTGDHVYAAPPALVNGVIYFGSQDNYLYALDASDGSLEWRYQTGGNIGSSPAVMNGVVYIGSNDNHLHAVNASNGNLIWKYQTGGGIDSRPVVANGIVYFGSGDHHFYAVNVSDGTLKWRYETGDGISRSTAALSDGVVYFCSYDDHLYALDASNGDFLWRYQTGGNTSSSPLVSDGIVYFGSDDNYLYAVDASRKPAPSPDPNQ